MALRKEVKETIVKKHSRSELDTGSSEVQIALLTARINHLSEHFKAHQKDHHGRRGLLKMITRRRSLLDYVKRTDLTKYNSLISELNLRK